jgi:alpha-L-fucosidase
MAVGCLQAAKVDYPAQPILGPSDVDPKYLKATPEDMQWWRDAKLGMFVCWGPVTLTGKEIGWARAGERRGTTGTGDVAVEEYDNLYKKWKPDKFDARQWVQVTLDMGAKYMIFLVKHHDGFCLYDSKLTDYKSTGPEAAWKHDVMADIAEACHKMGLKLIVYYSQPDWYHPDYFTENHHRYIKYLHGQIREILTNYGPIDGLWFDLGYTPKDWDSYRLFKMIRQLQPGIIINNRCGLPGDFDTPEQYVGRFQKHRPWESCITLGTQWAWKPKDKIKSLKQCIDILVRCVGGDGNLALNTNPMPDGEIEPRQVERFREIGKWLNKYGHTLYATRGGPFRTQPWGACTYKDNKIFVHILDWDWLGRGIILPPIDKKITSVSMVTGGTVEVEQNQKGIALAVPPGHRRKLDTIIQLQLDSPVANIKIGKFVSGSLASGKKATASKVWADKAEFGPQQAFDDDMNTCWNAGKIQTAWLQVDLGKETTFDRAIISESPHYVRKFQLQYQDGDKWKTFHQARIIGENLAIKFEPVTARLVRLNIINRSQRGQLKIEEFQLFAPQTFASEAKVPENPQGGALAGQRPRVIVSSDIGGGDPDDFQSMVHYLTYADIFDTEGLISSPPHKGRKKDILEVLDAYQKDYSNLKKHSPHFPTPDALHRITKQGAIDAAPPEGYRQPTEGSKWIIQQAHRDDPRPLYVIVWGSITDVAQALHDDPTIKNKIRVYYIGCWNTRNDKHSREYVYNKHPDLWLIETDTTFRGMYLGGNKKGDLHNRTFVKQHVKGHGALGDLYWNKKKDIKMGDTPSVLYLMRGNPGDPTSEHWGGMFRKDAHGPNYWTDLNDPKYQHKEFPGANTVNKWRVNYLRDWQIRMDWAKGPTQTQPPTSTP